jgi:hypothetical protein
MATGEQHIEAFLKEFRQKKKIYGLLFRDDRAKNQQTLLDLEITSRKREEIIDSIQVRDYVEGPKEESLYKGAAMWVFGKQVKGRDVYIKITMGFPSTSVICISFHIAERTLTYPFKT